MTSGRIDGVRRPLLLAILVYVGLDLSLPAMPGAFVFEPGDSVESLQVKRGRAAAEVAVKPAPAAEALIVARAAISLIDRAAPADGATPARRPVVSRLPRAALAPAPVEDAPHHRLPLA